MKKLKRDSLRLFLGYFGTIVVVMIATFLLKQLESLLEIQSIALIYLLPVLLCTALWGFGAGLLAGILAFLSFNYFFIPPFYTLLVHRSQDLITLLVFLIMVVVINQYISKVKAGVNLAKAREWEAKKMYELISSLAGLTRVQDILQTMAKITSATFSFVHVKVISTSDQIGFSLEEQPVETSPDVVIPMETSRNLEGEIQVWKSEKNLSIEEERLAMAFGYQGALAIERAHLVLRENEAKILEESDRIKSALLSSVSHELRSPLSAIKASVSSLRSGAVSWDSQAGTELLSMIEEETDQLNLLVGNLLDMSRIEAGALLPKKQWNSILEIIKGVAVKHQKSLLSHNPVEFFITDDISLVPSDYVMMEQVFTNLFSNSVKYAPAGTPIQIYAEVKNDSVLIRLVNQSPPVPGEHLEHIFDKFFRITKADKVTGTGLGLSICKGIIEAHGGKIWAENQPEGFTFNILLPVTLNGEFPTLPKDEQNE